MTIRSIRDVCDLEDVIYNEEGPTRDLPEGWRGGSIVTADLLAELLCSRVSIRRMGGPHLEAGEISRSLDFAANETAEQASVLQNIKAAPVAYFKFFSALAFALFTFSLVFYYISDTILVNPIFGAFGALGSAFCWVLVSVSGRLVAKP